MAAAKTPRVLLGYLFFFLSLLILLSGIGTLLAYAGIAGLQALIALILIAVGITSLILSLFFFTPEPIVLIDRDDIYDFLNESEREILELVAEKGELSHTQLVELTGFSHAKVSRITQKLEKMGLIHQYRENKRKKVKLKSKARRLLGI